MEFKKLNIVGVFVSIIIAITMVMPVGLATNNYQEPFADVEKMYFIDLGGAVQTEWSDTLDAMEIDIITYVQGKGYEVRMNDQMKSIAGALPYVTSVIEVPLESKISPDIAANGDDIVISLIESDSMKDTVKEMGNFVDIFQEGTTESGYIIRGTLKDASLLNSIASYQDVHYISPYIAPELHSEIAAQIGGGGLWYYDDDADHDTPYRALGTYGSHVNQMGWYGNGVRIAIADTGIGDGTTGDAGHNDFQARVVGGYDFGTGGWVDQHGHGTHCIGIAAGDTFNGNGVTYAGFGPYYVGQGLASQSTLFAEQIFEGAAASWVGPADYRDIVYEGWNGGAQVQTNSWGSNTGGAYSAHDEAYDHTIRDADTGTAGCQQMVIFTSAGNAGSGANTIGSPGNSKNIITVGGVKNYAPDASSYGNTGGTSNDPDAMYLSSSRGWTDDGRIKPDILTPGEEVLSTHSPSAGSSLFGLYSPDNRYEWCTGTSQSCPGAAGGGALIYEWYDFTYGIAPTPATVKALMINTAVDIGVSDIPNQNEGWGRMNIMPIFDQPAPFIIYQDPTELTTGVTDTYTFSYADGGEPLKISMAYTDRYALNGAAVALQNQVNLEVETPLGTIYHGNAFSGGWSTTGNPPATFDTNADGYDDRNNVECVYIPSGSLDAGQYTVRIIGTDVPADCDFDGSNDQDYSLVIFNGLDVSSLGTVDLDKDVYMGEDTATVTIKDSDLDTSVALQQVTITVDSTSEPAGESVTCTETGDSTGVFVGTLTLSATNSAGVLQVSHGDTVTATYDDADDGTGSPNTVTDTATIDSQVGQTSGLTVEWWGSTSMTWIDEDFSTAVPPAGWTEDGPAPSWAQVGSATAGGTAPEANLHWIDTTDSWHLYAGPFDTTGTASMDLQWQNMVNDYGAGVTLSVQTSTNAATWNNAGWSYTSGTGDMPANLETLTVNTGDVGSSTFYISWSADGNLYQIDDWYIDDVLLTSVGGSTTDDNWLNWTLSGDDGAGANDVSHYNIYRANNAGGPWDAGAIIDTAPAGTDTYFDFDKGEPDGINWWYVVRAEDLWGNEDTNVNAVPEQLSGNLPPNAPISPVPADLATGIGLNPTLSVDVTDPNADVMDVDFYDASDDSLIGFDNNVASGGTASVSWNGRAESTTYTWYAIADDGEFTTQSATWSFTTIDTTPPASPTGLTVEHWGGGGTPVVEGFQATNGGGIASASLVLDAPAGITVGELLLLIVGNEDAAAGAEFTDNLAGWNYIGTGGDASADADIGAFWRIADGTEGATVTVTATSSDDWWGWYVRISGADTTTPINVNNFAQSAASSNSHVIPQVTTTADDCLAIYALSFDGGDGFPFTVAGAGWSESDEQQAGIGTADGSACWGTKDQATAGGTGTATVGCAISDGAAYFQLAIQPASGGGLDDNAVNWTASADDGAGADDVDYYNIYRSDVEAGPWDMAHIIDTEPATGAASYSYIDLLRGQADATLWWYVVRAVDLSTNEDSNSVAVQEPGIVVPEFLIPVQAGWNFISSPLVPGDTSIPTVFTDLDADTTWTYLQYYDGTDGADHWKTYNEAYPGAPDLNNVDEKMGVWIFVDTVGDGIIRVEGSNPSGTTINLVAGWNLVGFPSQVEGYTAGDLKTDSGGLVTSIERYNDAAAYDIEIMPDGDNFLRGQAYWVYSTGIYAWVIP